MALSCTVMQIRRCIRLKIAEFAYPVGFKAPAISANDTGVILVMLV